MKELPPGWVWTTLGDMLPFRYGKSLAGDGRRVGTVPVMGSSGVVGTHDSALTTTGCIVIGRKGSAGSVYWCPEPCWPLDTVYFTYAPDNASPQLLYYLLSYLQLRKLDRSTAVPSLLRQDLEAVSVSIPPCEEQRRIVTEIEKHLTRLDTAVEQLTATQRKIAAFATSVIRRATSAKPHWRMTRAADLCEFITKGTTPSADQLLAVGDIPYLKVNNLTFGGPLDFSRSRTFIRKNVHDNELSRSKVLPGDVLMNIVGPPLGKVAVVPDAHPEYNINQAIARFRPVSGIDPRYLALLLRNGDVLSWALSRAKTTAGQVNLTLELCRDLPLPIAPETEQRQIVAAVDAALAPSENASASISVALARAARLRQAILKKAFDGKLVPQDPNDEPASVLLERIRSARAHAPTRRRRDWS